MLLRILYPLVFCLILLSCQKEVPDNLLHSPREILYYSSNVSPGNLDRIERLGYDNKGRKYQTMRFNRNNIHTATDSIEFNADGMMSKERFLIKQPDGSFKEGMQRIYTYAGKWSLSKKEEFIGGELKTWIVYSYQDGRLKTETFYVHFTPSTTDISGKNEYEYNEKGQKKIMRQFYGTNTLPSFVHNFVYQDDLLIKDNITTNLYPETIDYTYNNNNSLLTKFHYEGLTKLASEKNTYDAKGQLSQQEIFNLMTSSFIHNSVIVYKY